MFYYTNDLFQFISVLFLILLFLSLLASSLLNYHWMLVFFVKNKVGPTGGTRIPYPYRILEFDASFCWWSCSRKEQLRIQEINKVLFKFFSIFVLWTFVGILILFLLAMVLSVCLKKNKLLIVRLESAPVLYYRPTHTNLIIAGISKSNKRGEKCS